MTKPMLPAVIKALASCGRVRACSSWRVKSSAGSTPLAPAVGAATMRPIAALASPTAKAYIKALRRGVPAQEGVVCCRRRLSPPTRPPTERTPLKPVSMAARITSSSSPLRKSKSSSPQSNCRLCWRRHQSPKDRASSSASMSQVVNESFLGIVNPPTIRDRCGVRHRLMIGRLTREVRCR